MVSRELLVGIHATAGVMGLVAGIAVFAPPASPGYRRWWRLGYGLLLVVLVVSLLLMISIDWPTLDTGARLAFSGLAALGVVMLARIYLAHRLAGTTTTPEWERRYVNHVYFTYVSLWVGLAIVPALRSPNPALWIPVAVIGVLTSGSLLVHRYQRRIGLTLEK